jgi:hypothetical protein
VALAVPQGHRLHYLALEAAAVQLARAGPVRLEEEEIPHRAALGLVAAVPLAGLSGAFR